MFEPANIPVEFSSDRPQVRQVQEYVADDPGLYIPSQKKLISQKSTILRHINTAIDHLLESKDSAMGGRGFKAHEQIPKLYEALTDHNFAMLTIRVYGVGIVKELSEKIFRFFFTMQDFLRGLLAAAVTAWCFDEPQACFLEGMFNKTHFSEDYEGEVKKSTSHQPLDTLMSMC